MAEGGSVERKVSFAHRATIRPHDQRPPHARVEDEAAVERRLVIGPELGRGSFGIVREVTSRVTGERLAVKVVNKDRVRYQPLPLSLQKVKMRSHSNTVEPCKVV